MMNTITDNDNDIPIANKDIGKNGKHEKKGKYENNGMYEKKGKYENNGMYEKKGKYENNGMYEKNGKYENNGKHENNDSLESPEYVRTSIAAAMTLGFMKGRFYRNATSPCINLLLSYDSGCAGNCSYCGLSRKREGEYTEKSFIRVTWPSYSVDEIIEGINQSGEKVERVCISMITNIRSIEDTIIITRKLREQIQQPVSLLITPTILKREDLIRFKEAGADKIGVAVDCARPDLFDSIRGRGVNGPHNWERYWECLQDSLDIFGVMNVGAHLIVGLGETEEEMMAVIQRVHDMGGWTHLFSFFPEQESALADHPQPPIGQYRRVQLARHIIDENIGGIDSFSFNENGKLTSYGIPEDRLIDIIADGKPFMTSGCLNKEGEVACNRPYANCVPGPEIRNYAFHPQEEDIRQITRELEVV